MSDAGGSEFQLVPGSNKGKMQKGDYVIHVHVQSTKNLDLLGAIKFDPYL